MSEQELEQQPQEPVEVVETPEAVEPDVDPAIETEARKYGWRPKGMFTKNPDNWVPADRFLELPQTHLKMQRDINRELQDKLNRIDQTTSEAVRRVREQERAQYEAQLARIRLEKQEAVKEADVERFNNAQDREDRLMRAAPQPPAYTLPDWTKDQEMFNFAAQAIDDTPGKRGLSPERQIKWVEKLVREEFPDKFPPKDEPKPQQPKTARVDGGGLASGRSRGFDDLPKEAQEVARRYVKAGYFKDTAEYAKSYWENDQ